jgi:hypothetical protein
VLAYIVRLVNSLVYYLERAAKWSETVESSVMMELESNVSTAERIAEYRTNVESKLLLLMMDASSSQQQVSHESVR